MVIFIIPINVCFYDDDDYDYDDENYDYYDYYDYY